MTPSKIEPEGFGPLHQPGYVGVPAQKIVDKLSPRRLLLPNHLPPRCLMALDQHLHCVVDHPQYSIGSRPHLLSVA